MNPMTTMRPREERTKVKPEEYEQILSATLRVIAQQPPPPLLRLALHFAAFCADELMEPSEGG